MHVPALLIASAHDLLQPLPPRIAGRRDLLPRLRQIEHQRPAAARARDEQGWHVHRVSTWEQLTVFAREFARMKYEGDAPVPGVVSGFARVGE